ncbi:hypothetical protein CASFOL_030378 [Castilleja foliolosa]|uniref:RING-type E3 ubiquitin transferase n=1 Tax=Castilleja foliolosa TaxID=1961234 RepID=A0ABD3C8Z0_9LAMI
MDLIESTPIASSPASYWCYQCSRVFSGDSVAVCPHCLGGFIQAVDPTDFTPPSFVSPPGRRRRRTGHSFNPLIVLRPPTGDGDERSYELFYDDGAGVGLRPLPSTMSEPLLGSGFELMLDRLSQIGFSLWARPENPPASKHAVASLPTVQISSGHVDSDSHCAVCTDPFTLGSEAREMPCNHIYHSDCIFPWLDLHNSCPVCRHELPSDDMDGVSARSEAVGLSIWRLPGGGFAVGRFAGGGVGETPAVYSELDGSMSLHGAVSGPEIEWEPWITPPRGGGLRRFLGSIFRRVGRPVRRSGSISGLGSGSGNSIFSRYVLRRNRSRDTSISIEAEQLELEGRVRVVN